MLPAQNETSARMYGGLYLRTQRQAHFWGWSSRRWGSLCDTETIRTVKDLAAWLRLAHESLDKEDAPLPSATAAAQPAHEPGIQILGPNRRFQFVCNRRMIGLLIR